jgi:hypothetical protein
MTPMSSDQIQFDQFQRQLCKRKSKKMTLLQRNIVLQDYLMYLANVKNIPIGFVGSQSMILLDGAVFGVATGALGKETATVAGGDSTFTNWSFATAF